jgi:hypothetical protein
MFKFVNEGNCSSVFIGQISRQRWLAGLILLTSDVFPIGVGFGFGPDDFLTIAIDLRVISIQLSFGVLVIGN